MIFPIFVILLLSPLVFILVRRKTKRRIAEMEDGPDHTELTYPVEEAHEGHLDPSDV